MSVTAIPRILGMQDYVEIWRNMQVFTNERNAFSSDEIWITEHPPVYTFGLNAKPEHLLKPATSIPIVYSDRGGQITYHGPGQLVIYLLLNIKRLNLSPRQIVNILENSVLATLRQYGVKAQTKPNAPGVFVEDKKIASLGLRIKHGCTYHGLSINNNMDLAPFQNINPCGYPGMVMTNLSELGVNVGTYELAVPVVHHIINHIEL